MVVPDLRDAARLGSGPGLGPLRPPLVVSSGSPFWPRRKKPQKSRRGASGRECPGDRRDEGKMGRKVGDEERDEKREMGIGAERGERRKLIDDEGDDGRSKAGEREADREKTGMGRER